MIILILGILALIGCGVCVFLDLKTNISDKILCIIAAACVLVSAVIWIPQINAWSSAVDARVENQQTYEELKTYAEVMENSNDEYARAMFYQEIGEWNNTLEGYKDLSDNIWIGSFNPNIYEGCEPIAFELSRGK